jgi:hypothetical protein
MRTRINKLSAILASVVVIAAHSSLAAQGLNDCFLAPSKGATGPVLLVYADGHGSLFADAFSGVPGAGQAGSRNYLDSQSLRNLCATNTLTVNGRDGFATLPSSKILIQEFINAALSSNFFLSGRDTSTDLIVGGSAGTGWSLSSNRFYVPRANDYLTPVHVFFGADGAGIPSHFYTASDDEFRLMQGKVAASSGSAKWSYDGIAFEAPRTIQAVGGEPFCPQRDLQLVTPMRRTGTSADAAAKYRYVVNPETVVAMSNAGWQKQLATFCAYPE